MMGWLFDQATAWLLAFTRDTLNQTWALLVATLFHLPDVTGLPQVAAVSGRALAIVNTGFVVVIMTVGIVVMTRDTVQSRYGLAELAPRMVIGLVAANFAPPICQAITTTANALVEALTGQGIASERSLAALLRVVTGALTNPASALLVTLIGLTIDVLLALLLVGWIARFVALIVAVGVAPAALACHALPWTEPIAQAWWRTMGGLSITVVLQAVALNTSLAIFLDPAANLPSYGMPSDPTGLFNLFIVAVLLYATVRIPALVRRQLTPGGRPNLVGTILRFVVVQQLTRGLGTGLRTAFGAGRLAKSRPPGPSRGSGGTGGPSPRRGGGPGRPPHGGVPPRRPPSGPGRAPAHPSSGTGSGPAPARPRSANPSATSAPPPSGVPATSATPVTAASPRPTAGASTRERRPDRSRQPAIPPAASPPVISTSPSRPVPWTAPRRPAPAAPERPSTGRRRDEPRRR
ncbi:hypothetical protein [Kineosporia sp. R_H_3]|uniref:hypothetical protein n=1 Tax=Kineosporia sp. R_H_3 TaxID=1961848 RepID=UPI0013040688|nr:hypothetical protein [Kineosporia sp. R_H_3]